MSYLSNITVVVIDAKHYSDEDAILKAVQEEYFGDINGDSIDIKLHHYWSKNDISFFKKLSKSHPGIIIELAVEGEESPDFWEARFKDGEYERLYADLVWPEFEQIRHPDDGPDAEAVLKRCLRDLRQLKDGSYWPFRSPNPCSTEKALTDNIESAIAKLEAAQTLDKELFTNGRSRTQAPSTSIERLK